MELKIKHPSLGKVLQYLKIQAQESVEQIPNHFFNNYDTPESFFYACKSKVKYKNDPINIEYIQTVDTMAKNNWRGDCDDFVVLALAGLTYFDLYSKLYICLVGKNKKYPSHIYVALDFNKRHYIFDLTNPYFDFERTGKYKYKQVIPINL